MKRLFQPALAAGIFVMTCAGAHAATDRATRQQLLKEAHLDAAAISLPGGLLGGLLGGGDLAATGDADSYGHAARFVGVAQTGFIELATDCTPDPSAPLGPDDRCIVVTPTPGVTQTFQAIDSGRLTLPANAARSLICPLITATVFQSMTNPSATPAQAQLRVAPSITFESTVLSDPRAVDPSTHLPYNGEITVSYTSHFVSTTLAPGASDFRQLSATRACIGGLSRQSLIQSYGLPADLADKFFQKPMTLHLNLVNGSARLVDFAEIYYGVRVLGDGLGRP